MCHSSVQTRDGGFLQDLALQMVGFPTDKQPFGSQWWDECPTTTADYGSTVAAGNQVSTTSPANSRSLEG
jgi:V8-like Glu-specific endopeptidase